MIIVVFGLPGTGKSFLSKILSEKLNAKYLNTDIIRKKFNKEGKYSQEDKEFVYQKLKEDLKESDKSKDVIVDGTFQKSHTREEFKELAREMGIEIYFIELKASERIIHFNNFIIWPEYRSSCSNQMEV